MTDTVVVEGQVKLRDGKKWRSRWVVLKKPSPVADCLSLLVYKDKVERNKGHRERRCLTLGDICGLEPGLSYEGVGYTLAIVSLSQSVLLGFDRRETLLAWDLRIRHSLGEAHRFNVHVLPGTKLESGPATLHLCNNLLVVTKDLPPVVTGQWKLSDLRRYGAVPNGFVFEGGTRCGSYAGVFFLACAEGEQISFLFDCIVRGISPSRSPFGLRPVLPDPGSKHSSPEERIQQEARELERRLSRLSTVSCQSSTASTSSYSTSIAGDDCSISSSSSEASHSDTSLGSRLTLWPEPSKGPATPSPLNPVFPGAVPSRTSTPTSRCMLTPSLSADEQLYAAVMGSAGGALLHPSSSSSSLKLGRGRGLRDTGRQGSTDSGIATTGSHSSYSGSFSSYTGSLDMAVAEAEVSEFGSLLKLPPSSLSAPSLLGLLVASGGTASTAELTSSCSCSVSTGTVASPGTPANSTEYLMPSAVPNQQPPPPPLQPPPPPLLQLPCYDTPRRLLPSGTDSGTLSGCQEQGPGPRVTEAETQAGTSPQANEVGNTSTETLADPHKGFLNPNPMCQSCRGAKSSHLFDSAYITQEQCLSARKKYYTQETGLMHLAGLPVLSFPERRPSQLSAVCPSAVSEHLSETEIAPATPEFEERGRYELMGTYAQLQRTSRDAEASVLVKPPFFTAPPRLLRQASVCGVEPKENYERMAFRGDLPSEDSGAALTCPAESSRLQLSDRFVGDGVNYVNIPISPTSKRQLHYMELDLQDLQEPMAAVRGGGSTKYAQIDITAMETAQRVGAQHALGREGRLQELEHRRRGALN